MPAKGELPPQGIRYLDKRRERPQGDILGFAEALHGGVWWGHGVSCACARRVPGPGCPASVLPVDRVAVLRREQQLSRGGAKTKVRVGKGYSARERREACTCVRLRQAGNPGGRKCCATHEVYGCHESFHYLAIESLQDRKAVSFKWYGGHAFGRDSGKGLCGA